MTNEARRAAKRVRCKCGNVARFKGKCLNCYRRAVRSRKQAEKLLQANAATAQLTARVEWLELVAWAAMREELIRVTSSLGTWVRDDGNAMPMHLDANGIPEYSPELHAALKEARGG